MPVKPAPSVLPRGEGYKLRLQYLYARRSAIDSLIRSLQQYDLSRIRWSDLEKPKSA